MTKAELLAALTRRGWELTSFTVASGDGCPAVKGVGALHVIHDLILECRNVEEAARLVRATRIHPDSDALYWPLHLLDAEPETANVS